MWVLTGLYLYGIFLWIDLKTSISLTRWGHWVAVPWAQASSWRINIFLLRSAFQYLRYNYTHKAKGRESSLMEDRIGKCDEVNARRQCAKSLVSRETFHCQLPLSPQLPCSFFLQSYCEAFVYLTSLPCVCLRDNNFWWWGHLCFYHPGIPDALVNVQPPEEIHFISEVSELWESVCRCGKSDA